MLEVKGNFTQNNGNNAGFAASGDHKVILSRESKQVIEINGTASRFANIEITNTSEDGVFVSSYFDADNIIDENGKLSYADGKRAGWKLTKDEEIEDIDLIYGDLDLNGHTLTVNGDFTQSGGTVNVNGGELKINGSYIIQTVDEKASAGSLIMTNDEDKVTVTGDFVMRSAEDHSGLLTAGTLTVGGNFSQYSGSNYNFTASGSHTVVLNGSSAQTVRFSNTNSKFNNLKIVNTSEDGVDFAATAYVAGNLYDTDSKVTNSSRLYLGADGDLADDSWSYDLNLDKDRKLSADWNIGGSLYLKSGVFSLNGHKLNVGKDTAVGSATLSIDVGTLNTERDLRIQEIVQNNDGTVTYKDAAYSYFVMTSEADFVKVGRDFVMYSSRSNEKNLTNGILEVKGDFTQKNGNDAGFAASGKHKVVLSGTKLQNVNIEGSSSKFNILEINKPLSTGYVFNKENLWNELIETALDTTGPTAPSELSAEAKTPTSVILKWSASTDDNGVAGYEIYRNGKRISSVAETSYID